MNEVLVQQENAATANAGAAQKEELLKKRRVRNGDGYLVLPDFACKLLGRSKLRTKSYEPAIRYRRE